MITLWGRRNSINVQKVLWTLDELAVAWRHVDAGGPAGGLDSPEFLAMNPHARVPVIEDGGAFLWESNAIVRYLCAAYAPDTLSPPDPKARARCDQWMDWAATALQPAIMGVFWGFYRTPAPLRDANANTRLIADSARLIRSLDAWSRQRRFVAGTSFSMADIPAGALMHGYYGMRIERPPAPAVDAWRARLADRKPYRDNILQPFEELFGRLAY